MTPASVQVLLCSTIIYSRGKAFDIFFALAKPCGVDNCRHNALASAAASVGFVISSVSRAVICFGRGMVLILLIPFLTNWFTSLPMAMSLYSSFTSWFLMLFPFLESGLLPLELSGSGFCSYSFFI